DPPAAALPPDAVNVRPFPPIFGATYPTVAVPDPMIASGKSSTQKSVVSSASSYAHSGIAAPAAGVSANTATGSTTVTTAITQRCRGRRFTSPVALHASVRVGGAGVVLLLTRPPLGCGRTGGGLPSPCRPISPQTGRDEAQDARDQPD